MTTPGAALAPTPTGLPWRLRLRYSARQPVRAGGARWENLSTRVRRAPGVCPHQLGRRAFPDGASGPVPLTLARVAELVDAADLKSAGFAAVPVRFRLRAPFEPSKTFANVRKLAELTRKSAVYLFSVIQ